MKAVKKLDIQDANNVSGGGWGYNKYHKGEYHDAGFVTQWTKIMPIRPDGFFLRLNGGNKLASVMYHSEANEYVDYYMSHTADEYLKYVQKRFPEVTAIYRGYDIG